MAALLTTRRAFFLLAATPLVAADKVDSFLCFITGSLKDDLVSVTVDEEPLLSGFVTTSSILGVAMSFRVRRSSHDPKLGISVGIDPDSKTNLTLTCDASKGRYILIEYQGKNKLSASQTDIAPKFR